MTTNVRAIPEGYHSVTPSLTVESSDTAIEFYTNAFGAVELSRFTTPAGGIMHAAIRIGDSMVTLGDEMPEMGSKGPRTLGGTPVNLFLYLENVDAAFKRAIDAGGKEIAPLIDQFWGDRSGCVEDPFGHRWWISQRIEDLTNAEMQKRADAALAEPQPA